MRHRLTLLLMLCFACAQMIAQQDSTASCGQQAIMKHFFITHPQYKTINDQVEKLLAAHNRTIQSGTSKTLRTTGVLTLPVVVHIVHNNGTENISDAQVFQGIQHLNEAYANSGYYDPADGVNTQIQFCMAQRDPANNATNGITRDVSTHTTMGGPDYYSDDLPVKDINRWNPLCYINIWLVKSIPTSVVGYAYLPSAHGTNVDGIIIEAGYFGSSYANDVVVAHEMGHYLGLYHTFEGGCTNNDCTADGDKVCDTPPDQSTAGISCTSSANSCTTDVLSGFATDQNDLTQDYMDYGNFNCMKVFTQGQSDRMNWFIQNVRKSLLACKSCMNPCPAPVTADFVSPLPPFIAGNTYTFTSTSVNAASYDWYVNGILRSSSANLSYVFPALGAYSIQLVAHSGNALCDDAAKITPINAVCGVTAGFTKSAATVAAGTNINFTNTSAGADSYQWLVNGTVQSTAANFVYTSSTAGDFIIQLIAKNSTVNCQQQYTDTVHFTCAVTTDFIPASSATLINTPITFTSTGSGETTYQWLVNGIAAANGNTFSYTFSAVGAYTIQLITGNGTCSATKTGLVYVNDKCGNAQYQFQKSYATGNNSSAMDIRATSDGGSVLAERVITGALTINASILKLDAAGNTQWMNLYSADGNTLFRKIKPTMDGGYVAIGNIAAAGSVVGLKTFIVKTNAAGSITWSRDLTMQGGTGNDGFDIVESADGSFYFTGTNTAVSVTGGSSDVLAGKLDALGNLLWIKIYDSRSAETGNGLAEDNTHLVICGNKTGQLANSGFLLQLNKADGSVAWAQSYLSVDENFLDVQVLADGYYVNALRRPVTGSLLYTDHVYLKTDFSGKLSYAKYIQPFGTADGTGWASSMVKPDGHIVSQTTAAFGGNYFDFIVQEIDPATGTLWAKKYNKSNVWMSSIQSAADNSLWVAGLSVEAAAPSIRTYVMKLDSMGNSGSCPSTAVTQALLTAVYNATAVDFTGKSPQAQVNRNHLAAPVDVTAHTVCQYMKCDSVPLPVDTCKLCDSIHVSGTDTVCSFTNPAIYSVKRRRGCPAIPTWQLSDTSSGTITVVNDSTISIIFKNDGLVTLYASINTGCGILQDSIAITVFHSPAAVDLGPDIQLCSFSTLKLSAGKGFASYVWNDGSVDSTLTAYNVGKYFVTATDYCGNRYSDTILIIQAPVIPFDLGPDLEKCNTDTLTITAPGNFAAYSWAANYKINTLNGATIKVWPSADTTYTVVAKVATGCTVVDTIRIRVKQSAPIHLGNDTSFCAGTGLLLQAPAGFNSYLWQDGSANTSYTAAQAGLYWLQATAANGCVSKDSVIVKNAYPIPLHFLDPEAELCYGKDLHLRAIGNWSAYRWFNNSSSSSITVTGPGSYWLQVTSADGCIATDTVMVISSSHCTVGIWFPNAFTPDNNGNNDTYKPIVTGMPVSFRLDIYNRFGEKVFETTDVKKGWDGNFKGRRQPPGGFVWYCVYQFTGEPAKMEKGALLLIR